MQSSKEIMIPAEQLSDYLVDAVIEYSWSQCPDAGSYEIDSLDALTLIIGTFEIEANAVLSDEWYVDYIIEQIHAEEECL